MKKFIVLLLLLLLLSPISAFSWGIGMLNIGGYSHNFGFQLAIPLQFGNYQNPQYQRFGYIQPYRYAFPPQYIYPIRPIQPIRPIRPIQPYNGFYPSISPNIISEQDTTYYNGCERITRHVVYYTDGYHRVQIIRDYRAC